MAEVPDDRAHERARAPRSGPPRRAPSTSSERAGAGLLQPRGDRRCCVAAGLARVIDGDCGRAGRLVQRGQGAGRSSLGGRRGESRNLADRYAPNDAPDQRHLGAELPSAAECAIARCCPYKVSAVDFKRLGQGDIVAAAGGLLLFFSLFLPWFGVSDAKENLCGAGRRQLLGLRDFHDPRHPAGAGRARALDPGVDRGPRPRAVLAAGRGDDDRRRGRRNADPLQRDRRQAGRDQEFVSLDIGWYLGLLGFADDHRGRRDQPDHAAAA